MELNEKIKNALIKIDFIRKYEELSRDFSSDRTPESELLEYVDRDEAMEIIERLGYKASFDRREKFFKIEKEKIGNYTFGFHIVLRYGSVEFIWCVWDGEDVILGSPWSIYSRLLIDSDYRISYPVFGTYEDLDEIFERGFTMYEEFKKAVISA